MVILSLWGKLPASNRPIQNTPGIALGKSGIHLSKTFNTECNEIGVRVYFHYKKAEKWFPYFEQKKDFIESKIGAELVWHPNPNNKDKVITLTKYFDLGQKENWKEAISWLTDNTIKFRNTFSKIINCYNTYESAPESLILRK